MITIEKKEECCGCTACVHACPKSCIEMRADAEGFLYPVIEKTKCVNCGKCDRVCPVKNHKDTHKNTESSGYVVCERNGERRYASSSGGFVNAILSYLSENGFYICGAVFDDDFNVVHRLVIPGEDISAFSGSKYVQSDPGDSFPRIRELLDQDNRVCFVGTGCQVEGLLNFLGKEYSNLITIGVTCHGVPSPKLWREYLDYQQSAYNAKITSVNFRDKYLGYQTPSMKIEFSNGKVYRATARSDMLLKSFFTHYALRFSCFHCPSKGIERRSDFTVFDCWNTQELIGKDDNLGFTAVIAHTENGKKMMEKLDKYCDIYQIDVLKLIPAGGGGMLMKNAKCPPNREDFFDRINNAGLKRAFDEMIPVTKKDLMVEKIKFLFGGSSMLQSVSRFRRLIDRRKKRN